MSLEWLIVIGAVCLFLVVMAPQIIEFTLRGIVWLLDRLMNRRDDD
jgi:hypothetical protein